MSIVQVCDLRDVECGSNSKNWCQYCPKLKAQIDKNLDEMQAIHDRITKINKDFQANLTLSGTAHN